MARFDVHVDVIVNRGSDILVMKRAVGYMTGAWYFPGGQLEEEESPEEGARREVREETGLDLSEVRLFRVWTYRVDKDTPAVGITFTAEAPPGTEPQINEEHAAYRWMPPEEYLRRSFSDEVLEALQDRPHARHLVETIRDGLHAYIAGRK